MAERSFAKRLGYDLLRVTSRLFGTALFGVRCFGRPLVPREGSGLVCANHQSFVDPLLIGLAFDRRMNYLARKTLFRFWPFRLLIDFFDAIPVDQDGTGLAGLKESLRRLRQGELLVIFPEGSRTSDGEIAPLMPGFCVLARRSRSPLIPVGIEGAFDAWPRTRPFPRLARLCVVIGSPMSVEEINALDDQQLVAEVDRRIRECHRRARACVRN